MSECATPKYIKVSYWDIKGMAHGQFWLFHSNRHPNGTPRKVVGDRRGTTRTSHIFTVKIGPEYHLAQHCGKTLTGPFETADEALAWARRKVTP